MGSHNGDNVDKLEVEDTRTSQPTVEIKIKTLDSQTYTLRVDKCVPVPTLKEQIATVTGILSEQQRLICRGRVLKDDQLLSAYHVEDGHTLHLVVREPIPPSGSMNDSAGPDYSPGAADTQSASGGSRVVVGTFNISDQTQGGMPDISRVLSAFMGSLGVPLNRNGIASDSNREPPTIVVHRTTTSSSLTDSTRRQPVSVSSSGQQASLGPTSTALHEHMYPPVIPDSLTTLSQYLNQVTAEFAIANGGEESSAFPGSPPFDDGFDAPELSQVSFRRGMPTAESLAEVLQSTRQLLINHTAESLSRLETQLQNQVNVADSSARMSVQSNAMRTGIILRNLGALLLELGRTTMMLRMGETPADAVVNAGSAVFVNEYGPNPIMVQPFPVGSELSGAGLGSSFLSDVDIRIRRGTGNQGVQTGQQQSQEPVSQATSGVQTPTASHRHAEVHIRPIRAVLGAVPVLATQSPDPSRGANGIVFPVMARVQPTSGNTTDARGSTADGNVGGQPVAENARPATATQYFEDLSTSLDEYLRTMLDVVSEQHPPQTATSNTNDQPTLSGRASDGTLQTDPAPSDEGIFLSNLLHQIMPYISQISASGSVAGPSSVGGGAGGYGQGNMENGNATARSSPRRQCDEPSSSEAKRQKSE